MKEGRKTREKLHPQNTTKTPTSSLYLLTLDSYVSCFQPMANQLKINNRLKKLI